MAVQRIPETRRWISGAGPLRARRYGARDDEAWDELLEAVEMDRALEARQADLRARNAKAWPEVATWGHEDGALSNAQLDPFVLSADPALRAHLTDIAHARRDLRRAVPALAVARLRESVEGGADREALADRVLAGFAEVRRSIEDARVRLRSGDLEIEALGPVLHDTADALGLTPEAGEAGDEEAKLVQGWIHLIHVEEKAIAWSSLDGRTYPPFRVEP